MWERQCILIRTHGQDIHVICVALGGPRLFRVRPLGIPGVKFKLPPTSAHSVAASHDLSQAGLRCGTRFSTPVRGLHPHSQNMYIIIVYNCNTIKCDPYCSYSDSMWLYVTLVAHPCDSLMMFYGHVRYSAGTVSEVTLFHGDTCAIEGPDLGTLNPRSRHHSVFLCLCSAEKAGFRNTSCTKAWGDRRVWCKCGKVWFLKLLSLQLQPGWERRLFKQWRVSSCHIQAGLLVGSLVRPCQTHVRPNHRKHPNLLILLELSCHCDSSQVDCEAFKACQIGCSMFNLNLSYSIIFLSLHDLARPCNSLPLSCLKLETLFFFSVCNHHQTSEEC